MSPDISQEWLKLELWKFVQRETISEFFSLNIGTSDIGHFTRIGRTLVQM